MQRKKSKIKEVTDMVIPDLIDIHCHIIPGIDDGSKYMEQTKNMLRMAYEDGIRKIIATPHYHIGRAMAEYEDIQAGVNKLNMWLNKHEMDMEIYPGCEIYYFSDAMDMLEEGRLHTMAGGRCILMEFDPMVDFRKIQRAVNEAGMNGYVPIVAHIERYMCMIEDFDRAIELIRLGALLQINAQSVIGECGKDAQKYTKKILKKKLISFVASDAHSDGRRRPVLSECYKYVVKKCGEDYAYQIFRDNQLAVIEDRF